MPRRPISLATHSYMDRSLPVSAQRLLNLYMEEKPVEGKVRFALHGTPGLRLWTSIGTGGVRGMHAMGENLFVVVGSELYVLDVFKAFTLLGTISGSSLVSMASNGTQVVIVTDVDIYVATTTTVVAATVSNACGVAFQDGYMLFAERNSQKFFISGLQDAESYDPTEFTLVNADPDVNMAIVNVNRETVIFGKRSAQIYYNSGQADFPFSRHPSGVIERGTVSARSVVAYQGAIGWLGDDLNVYIMQGGALQKVSTPAIDIAIAGYTGHSAAHAIVYQDEGHIFYCLTFPEATICYDVSTQRWHERKSEGLNYWRARGHAFFDQQNLVGDVTDGKIYELDLDTYTDNGDTIRREVVAPPIHAEDARAFLYSVELDVESGVGLVTGQGSEPEVALDWSDDGGFTWSSERWRQLGRMGERRKRVKWNRLGQFRERSLRFAITDPVKVAILAAYANVEGAEA
jgi:hypothetical protein